MFIIISSISILLISIGIYFRRKASIHIPLMISAFVLDLALVLVIELQRHAVEAVIDEAMSTEPSLLLLFHALISILVIAFYIVLGFSGSKALQDRAKLPMHSKFAYIFIALRLINFVTSMLV